MVYPRGNKADNQLSVFLDCPDAGILQKDDIPQAKFTLTLMNRLDSGRNHGKGIGLVLGSCCARGT